MASLDWLRVADNEWGLPRFYDELERSAAAPTAAARDGALARALLAAGADRAPRRGRRRSDLRARRLPRRPRGRRRPVRALRRRRVRPRRRARARRRRRSIKPRFDVALPRSATAPGSPIARTSRFFTPGTLPDSGRYACPRRTPGSALAGYAAGAVPHLVRYERTPRGIVWSLDERCFADYARVLLPETARYAAGALELLFRGRLEIAAAHGSAKVSAHDVALGRGTRQRLRRRRGRARAAWCSRARVTGAGNGDALARGRACPRARATSPPVPRRRAAPASRWSSSRSRRSSRRATDGAAHRCRRRQASIDRLELHAHARLLHHRRRLVGSDRRRQRGAG